MDNNAVVDISEYYRTPLAHLVLPDKYNKLIKRIKNASENNLAVETVEDIVSLDPNDFAEYKGVGKLYVEMLIEFKKEYLPSFLIATEQEQEVEEPKPQIELSKEQLETPLNQLALSAQYQRLIKRISNTIGNINTVQNIISIDPVSFSQLPAVGKSYVSSLIELKKLLPFLLQEKIKKSALFSNNYSIEFSEIDTALIEDVEIYLWTLDERKMDVALSRWGFNKQHETLEEVGNRYGLTRERIRQFEKTINANLALSLRIQPNVLWANIREKMTEDLTILLPNLAKCFAEDKLFYEFIELCCQVESGSIHKIVFVKINSKIIKQLFCKNQSPIEQDIIINELMSNYGYSKAAAVNGIKQLAKLNKIEINEQGIYPRGLGKEEAVAHVLTFHPAGLPWKDIARIVNRKGYSSTPFDEVRQTGGRFSESEYIYLCDKGTYRNLIFLDIEQFDIPKIMQHLLNYFEQHKLNALHLHDYYYQTKGMRSEIEYFTLRHIVREHGEEYGLYFNGKSNADGVTLNPDLKAITQSDVIIKVLNESKVAMTNQEIAERLRSKSSNHASFLLNHLIEEGRVVRVDKMVYTTPEKAFKNIDTEAVMRVIRDIMNTSSVIVEADVFREYVNLELNLSYSKYIYAALVRTKINELGWYRNGTLFSKDVIPYKSLADLCRQLCNSELSNDQNTKILQQAVWLTHAVEAEAIKWWKWQLNQDG